MPSNLYNSAEGGTNGTTVLTSNSGGASGNAFDSVTAPPVDGVLAFDNTHVAHGSLAYKFQIGATSSQMFLQWLASFSATNTTYAKVSFNSYLTANPAASLYQLHVASAAAAQVCGIRINTSGQLIIVNQAGSTIGTMTSAIPLNAWFRVEADIALDALQTSVQVTVARFDNIDSGQSTDQVTATGATAVPFSRIRFGWGGTATTNAGPWWMDDLAVWVPSASNPAQPGRTWRHWFKHPQQQLPQPSVVSAPPPPAVAPPQPPQTARFPAQFRRRSSIAQPPLVPPVAPPAAVWIPQPQTRRPAILGRRRGQQPQPLVVQVQPPPVAQSRRAARLARRRGTSSTPVPQITVWIPPAKSRRSAWLLRPTGSTAIPIPPPPAIAASPPPPIPNIPRGRTFLRLQPKSHRADPPWPIAVIQASPAPPVTVNVSRRQPWLPRRRGTAPTPVVVTVTVPPAPQPRRRTILPRRRGQATQPVPVPVVVVQVQPPPPTMGWRKRPLPRRRSTLSQPVPQVVFVQPTPPIPPVRRTRRGLRWIIGRKSSVSQSVPTLGVPPTVGREITIVADLTATRWGSDATAARYGSDFASTHGYRGDLTAARYDADLTADRWDSDFNEQ